MASRAGGALIATAVAVLASGCTASAGAPQPTTAGVPAGPSLTAEPTHDLPGRTTVTVRGSGYDATKGIYVAYCVRPAAGEAPTPCGGGVNKAGGGTTSHWISTDPPPYGRGLAQPFAAGGTFEVRLTVTPAIGDVDCRVTQCVVATRADHTRSTDRSADVFVPVTFATTAPQESP